MSDYWHKVAQEVEWAEEGRRRFKADHEQRAKERAATFAKGRPARNARTVFRRDVQRRVRLYPWTAMDLDDLAYMRTSEPGSLAAAAVESVISLWKQYEYDEHLYIRRVELPTEAEAVIGVPTGPPARLVSMGTFEGFLTKFFGRAVLALLGEGVTVEVLIRQLRELEHVRKERR